MMLMTKKLISEMPPLYSQEKVQDPICRVKFFHPFSNWYWYATEYDPVTRIFFGYVIGQYKEMGYFSLDEMQDAGIERDLYYTPITLSEVRKLHA